MQEKSDIFLGQDRILDASVHVMGLIGQACQMIRFVYRGAVKK